MKPAALPLAALLLVASFASSTAAPEEKRPTLAEARAEFEKADAGLNRAYGEVREALPEWLFERLREEQKEWIEFRDRRAESDVFFNEGGEYEGRETERASYWESMTWTTRTRTEMIEGWLPLGAEGGRDIPWSGLWTDGYGGWLLLEEGDDPKPVAFRIHVVRGPTYHLGNISGEARRNGNAGFFTDEGHPDYHFGDEGHETWIYFDKDPSTPRIEVKGVHTQPYHGARAYFDGVYTRLRDATAEDREMFEHE